MVEQPTPPAWERTAMRFVPVINAELLALAKLVTVCCIGAVCDSRARSVITEPYAAWKISIQFTGVM